MSATPARSTAYVRTMRRVLLGDGLVQRLGGDSSRPGWSTALHRGLDRLRAGLPPDWRAGDKTGTGDNGAVNDVAIARPAGRPPILVAVFMSGSSRPVGELNAAHVKIGRTIVAAFG